MARYKIKPQNPGPHLDTPDADAAYCTLENRGAPEPPKEKSNKIYITPIGGAPPEPSQTSATGPFFQI